LENGALLGRRRHLRRLLNFVQHVYRLRSLRHEHLLLVHTWYDVDLVLELRLHEKLLSFFFSWSLILAAGFFARAASEWRSCSVVLTSRCSGCGAGDACTAARAGRCAGADSC